MASAALSSPAFLRCGRWTLDLSKPHIAGIINVTPDSFSQTHHLLRPEDALAHAEQLVRDGAHLLDVGAESTRPGARIVPPAEEWTRLAPVLKELTRWDIPVAVDTRNPETMRLALALGVDMINDINALRSSAAREALAAAPDACVCLMHMRGTPQTMQQLTDYHDVVTEVCADLQAQLQCCLQAGIARERICLDPGFGFAKNAEQNWTLLRNLGKFTALGVPIYVGLSNKSMQQSVTGRPVTERLAGSLATMLFAAQCGAKIFRVHDVRASVDALKIWQHLHP